MVETAGQSLGYQNLKPAAPFFLPSPFFFFSFFVFLLLLRGGDLVSGPTPLSFLFFLWAWPTLPSFLLFFPMGLHNHFQYQLLYDEIWGQHLLIGDASLLLLVTTSPSPVRSARSCSYWGY